MSANTENSTKVIKDTNVKRAVQQETPSVDTLVSQARTVMENTSEIKDLPKLKDIAKSNAEWESKYANHEEKKASVDYSKEGYPRVTEVDGFKVLREIPSENYYRYPNMVRHCKDLGYRESEIRLFETVSGRFSATDLQGNELDKKAQPIDRLSSIENKLDLALGYLENISDSPLVKGRFPKKSEIPNDGILPCATPKSETVEEPKIPYSVSSIVVDDVEEPPEKKLTKEEILVREKHIVNDYICGTAMKDISEEYNVSMGTIYGILNKNNVNLRSTGSSTGMAGIHVREYLEDDNKRKQLIKAYTDNVLTLEEIYICFDINKNGLFFILDRYKIPRRSPTRMENTMTSDET